MTASNKRPVPRSGSKAQESSSARTNRSGDKPKTDPSDKPSSSTRLRVKDPLRYKTVICENWASRGSCPYSHKCQFAHGEHELRTKHPGEKRSGRSASLSKPMSPMSGPALPAADPAECKRLAPLRASGRESSEAPTSCEPSPRSLSPFALPRSWNPTWGPRDGDFLHDLRGGCSPCGSYDSTLTAPLTPRLPYSLPAFGTPDLLAGCSPPFPPVASPLLGALPGTLSLASPPLSPGAESASTPLLLSPLLTAALPALGKWSPHEEPLVCNPVTGDVELAPNPPSVRAREASHNTLSVRRSISLLWNEDERVDMTEGEREGELAQKMAGTMWGWGAAAAAAQHGPKPAPHEGPSTRSSSYSSAIEDEAGDEDALLPPGLPPARLVPPAGTYAPASAPPPGLGGTCFKGQPDWQRSHGVENVQHQFDYLFRDLNSIRAN